MEVCPFCHSSTRGPFQAAGTSFDSPQFSAIFGEPYSSAGGCGSPPRGLTITSSWKSQKPLSQRAQERPLWLLPFSICPQRSLLLRPCRPLPAGVRGPLTPGGPRLGEPATAKGSPHPARPVSRFSSTKIPISIPPFDPQFLAKGKGPQSPPPRGTKQHKQEGEAGPPPSLPMGLRGLPPPRSSWGQGDRCRLNTDSPGAQQLPITGASWKGVSRLTWGKVSPPQAGPGQCCVR